MDPFASMALNLASAAGAIKIQIQFDQIKVGSRC
jgi:hypothetical protein